jgi:hypothetical protein
VVAGITQSFAHVSQRLGQAVTPCSGSTHTGCRADRQHRDEHDGDQVAEGAQEVSAGEPQRMDQQPGCEHRHRHGELRRRLIERHPGGCELGAEDVRNDGEPGWRIDGLQASRQKGQHKKQYKSRRTANAEVHERGNRDRGRQQQALGNQQQQPAIEAIGERAAIESEGERANAATCPNQRYQDQPDVLRRILLDPEDLRHELQRHQHLADGKTDQQQPEVAHTKRRKGPCSRGCHE